jgi:hypothetical protein
MEGCEISARRGEIARQNIRIFDYRKFAELLRDRIRDRAHGVCAEAGIEMALLHKSRNGKSIPISSLFTDYDRHRHTMIGHSVESRPTDPCLGFLLWQRACFHDFVDDALVASHGQFDMDAQVVARFSPPRDMPLLCNGLF